LVLGFDVVVILYELEDSKDKNTNSAQSKQAPLLSLVNLLMHYDDIMHHRTMMVRAGSASHDGDFTLFLSIMFVLERLTSCSLVLET
jgi:hypothetical protein